jgi:hypothetical protein
LDQHQHHHQRMLVMVVTIPTWTMTDTTTMIVISAETSRMNPTAKTTIIMMATTMTGIEDTIDNPKMLLRLCLVSGRN